MHIKHKLILPFLLTLLMVGRLSAQTSQATKKDDGIESIMRDVKPLYLQKLIDTAEKYYPQVKLRAERTKIATTTYHQSKASWFEGISITPSYVYNPGSSINLFNTTGASTNFFNGYQIAFSISISSFITRPYITRNAKQAITVAKLEEDEYKITLRTQVKHFYYVYLSAQAQLRQAVKATLDAQVYADQVKYKFLKEETTLAEYNNILTAFNASVGVKLTAELAVLDAKASLEEFVGKRLEDIR